MSRYLIYSQYWWSINVTRFVRFTIILLFCLFGYTTWNESFEFLLGKCQRAKSHGTMGVGVGMGVGACYFFFVFFPCLFLCFSSPYWCWIEEGSHIKFIKVHYFLVNSLIFSPSFPLLYLISSPYSLRVPQREDELSSWLK